MDQAGCHNWEQLLKLGLWDRAWGAGFCLVLGDLVYVCPGKNPLRISLYFEKVSV